MKIVVSEFARQSLIDANILGVMSGKLAKNAFLTAKHAKYAKGCGKSKAFFSRFSRISRFIKSELPLCPQELHLVQRRKVAEKNFF